MYGPRGHRFKGWRDERYEVGGSHGVLRLRIGSGLSGQVDGFKFLGCVES